MNYRSRAAFKLIEIVDKYKLLKQRNYRILELGAAPGSWTQVLQRRLLKNSHVVALDQDPVKPLFLQKNQPQISYMENDIFDLNIISKIKMLTEGRQFDMVLSDMSPNISGVNDEFKVFALNYRCIEIAQQLLKKKGVLVIKGFMNSKDPEFMQYLNLYFNKVQRFKPESSRKKSNEIYYINEGFKKTEFWNLINQQGKNLSLDLLLEKLEQQTNKDILFDLKDNLVQIMKQRIIDENIQREDLKYQFERDLFDCSSKVEKKKPLEKMSIFEAKKEAQKLLQKNPNNKSLQALAEFPIEEEEIHKSLKELENDNLNRLQDFATEQKLVQNQLLDLEKETKKFENQVEIIEDSTDPYKQALNELSPFDIQKIDDIIEILEQQSSQGVDINKLTMDDIEKITKKQKEEVVKKYDYFKDQEMKEEVYQENRQLFDEFQQALGEFEGDTYHQQKIMELLDSKVKEKEHDEQIEQLQDKIRENQLLELERQEEKLEERMEKDQHMQQRYRDKQEYQKYLNRIPRQQMYEKSKGKKKFD